jgi:hypothetical protein
MENLQAKAGFLPGLSGLRKKKTESASLTSKERREKAGPKPIAFFKRLPNGPRNHFIAMVGEFTGTFLFLCVPPTSSKTLSLIQCIQILGFCRHADCKHTSNYGRLSKHRSSSRP